MKFIHNIKKKKKTSLVGTWLFCAFQPWPGFPRRLLIQPPTLPSSFTSTHSTNTYQTPLACPGAAEDQLQTTAIFPAHSFHCPHPCRPSHPSSWVGRVLITGVISKLRATGPQIQRSHLQKQITIWEGRYSHSRTNNTVGPQKTIPEWTFSSPGCRSPNKSLL